MRPASTSCAPSQSTTVIAPNTSIVPSAVSTARTRVRLTPVTKLASTAAPKRSLCSASSV